MLHDRIAGAPISWGVSEVEGWGFQLPREHVLMQMRELGLKATEFGPVGWLPRGPRERARLLSAYGLTPVGGFLPVVLHEGEAEPLAEFDAYAEGCVATGAGVVVLAAASGGNGYDVRPTLDEAGWSRLCSTADLLHSRAGEHGLRAVLHPHIGTLVEGTDDLARVLAGSRISLCVDTGHLRAAGVDPVGLVEAHADRVGHVHLKDVDVDLAREVHEGGLPFSDAVRAGLFRPLGAGDVDVAGLVAHLERSGYDGWYVLEQDVMLDGPPSDAGPAADVRTSVAYLEGLQA